MVYKPRLSLPKKLLRRKHGEPAADGIATEEQTSPFQAAALPGAEPLGRLRVQVYAARDLRAADLNGTSDPFVRISAGGPNRMQGDVVSKTLNPVWGALPPAFNKAVPDAKTIKQPTILEFETFKDTIAQQTLEVVLWDKDRFSSNDYLGEVDLGVEHWFSSLRDGAVMFNNPENLPQWYSLSNTRNKKEASGDILVQVGFVATSQSVSGEEELAYALREAILERYSHGRVSRTERVLTAPPTQSVGTMPKRTDAISGDAMENYAYEYELAGDSSSAESDEDEVGEDESDALSVISDERDFTPAPDHPEGEPSAYLENSNQLPDLVVSKEDTARQVEPETADTSKLTGPSSSSVSIEEPTPSVPPKGRKLGFPLFKRTNSTRSTASVGAKSTASSVTPQHAEPFESTESLTGESSTGKKKRFPLPKRRGSTRSDAGHSSADIPPADPKPKKRKRKIRKSKDYEFRTTDVVGVCFLEVMGATDLPRWKDATRLTFDMDPFVVLSFGKKVFRTRVLRHTLNPKWDERLFFHVRAHELGYNMQLDVYDWDRVSSNDLVGRTSTNLTPLTEKAPLPAEDGLYACDDKGFLLRDQFQSFNLDLKVPNSSDRENHKHPQVQLRAKYVPYEALRQQFWRQYLTDFDADGNGEFTDIELFAMLDSLGSTLSEETLHSFFSRFKKSQDRDGLTYDEVVSCLESELTRSDRQKMPAHSGSSTPPDVASLADNRGGIEFSGLHSTDPRNNQRLHPTSVPIQSGYQMKDEIVPSSSSSSSINDEGSVSAHVSSATPERVINIKECPLCHKPRLNKRSEVDIITHLAICASQDWSHMGSLMVSNYVTSEQAHRKWLRKAISRVTKGAYSLGADSANLLVQNRMTGQLIEEKMQIYVRLGIRLGYRGMTGTVEGGRVKRLFASMSVKQGLKYDSPDSAEEIAPFIAFHGLDMNEVKDPIESFKTFNEFFYRKLKAGARPPDEPQNPNVLVSAADCRLMAFQSIDDATRVWIKGKDFSIARMLGNRYGQEAKRYEGGSLVICRLAPQDYHRYHSPVDGTLGEFDKISGLYYTVNPMAIRSQVDVYGENKREVGPIDSAQFGRVMMVYVGAMLVAGIEQTVHEGEPIKRADEIGYFKFGGSTIIMLFEPGKVVFDADILKNSDQAIETLVRVGMRIGITSDTT